MNPKPTTPLRAISRYSLAFAALATGLPPICAAPITVPNAGFEDRQRADGVDDYNQALTTPNPDVWRHWQRTENGGPLRVWNPGAPGAATQGNITEGFGGNAPDGNMVQLVYSRYSDVATKSPPDTDGANYFSAATQLLSTNFDATKIYKLTAKVGNPIVPVTNVSPYTPVRPTSTTWLGYSLQLAAGGTNVNGSTYSHRVDGGTVVAQDANTIAVPSDQFGASTVWVYPTAANAGLTGQALQIRLASLENPNYLSYIGYTIWDSVTLEEFTAPTLAHWDLDDTTPGSGGSSPGGTWNAANTFWNPAADGSGIAAAWTPGQTAVFSAGVDATGTYTITVDGTQSVGGLAFQDGTVTLTGGTALQLAQTGTADVASGLTATVETPITEATLGLQLGKTGTGTLVLSGANAYTGGTAIMDGTLRLGAANALPDTGAVSISGISAGTTTLDLNGISETIGGLILGGTSASSGAAVTTGAGTLTLAGDLAYVNASSNGVNPLGATISGLLDLGAAARTFTVNNSSTTASDLTISANITGSNALTKTGFGTLVLSGSNSGHTGGLVINHGVVQFESAGSINGTTRNVNVSGPGTVVFGSSFGAGNIPSALLDRIEAASTGIIAVDNYLATNFDFSTAGLTSASLGAVTDSIYTGTLTPNGGVYRLGGGYGTLTMANANALTGGNSAEIGSEVTLLVANDYSGGTIINGGTLFEKSATVLSLGDNSSLGSGTVTISGASTIQSTDSTARTLANACSIGASYTLGGTGDLTFTGSANLTVSPATIAVNNTTSTFSNALSGIGGLAKSGTGTMILSGNNTHAGVTSVSAGTLVLSGNNSGSAGVTSVSAGTLVLSGNNSGSAGGVTITGGLLDLRNATALGTATLTLSGGTLDNTTGPLTISTVAPILLNGNFTYGATNPLNLGTGAITLNNTRTITLNGTGSTLTFGGVMTNTLVGSPTLTVNGAGNSLVISGGYALSNSSTNYTPVISGTGNVIINGAVTNGGTATASALTKTGTGTLTLNGNNTYDGLTTHSTAGSTLTLAGDNSGAAGGITLGNATAVLNVNHAAALGTGTLTLTAGTLKNSVNLLTTTHPVTFGTGFTWEGLNNLTFLSGAISLPNSSTIVLQGTGSVLTFGGVLTNTFAGNPTLTANGAGNTLVISGGFDLSNSASNRTPVISGTGNVTINGPVTNGVATPTPASACALTKTGTGTLTLNGNNTYDGLTTHSTAGSTLTLAGDNSGAAGGITLGNATAVLNVNHAAALGTGTLTLTAGTFNNTSGSPKTLTTNNTVVLNGNTSWGGSNNLTFGTGDVQANATGRTITLTGTGTLTFGGKLVNTLANNTIFNVSGLGKTMVAAGLACSNSVSTRTFTVQGDGNLTITGAVIGSSLGGSENIASGLTHSGTGTLTLNGVNTYAGATLVNSTGCLALVGGSQNSAITVNSGAFLGFTLGQSTTSTKAVTLSAGHKVRITGTPTPGTSYTLLTTSASIGGVAPVIETPLATHALEVQGGGTTLVLKSLSTPFQDWALLKGLTGANNAKTDDPDGDGKNNNFEFAFNGNPLSGSDNGMIAGLVQDASLPAGNELTLVVAVRNGATFGNAGSPVVQTATVDGVTYTIQGTLDLVTIPGSDVSHVAGPSNTAPSGSGLTADLTSAGWKYHTFKLVASEGLGSKGFLRAKAQ